MTIIVTMPWAAYRPGRGDQLPPSSAGRPRAIAVDCAALRRADTRRS
jgi:hypothetical protein